MANPARARHSAAMTESKQSKPAPAPPQLPARAPVKPAEKVPEIGGRKGPEPTRYGDWEKNGRCIDF